LNPGKDERRYNGTGVLFKNLRINKVLEDFYLLSGIFFAASGISSDAVI
jgi:hypothetical protein